MLTTRGCRRDQAGYSLLEALAAVFIVALASSLVVAAMPAPIEEEERLVLAFAAKLDQARAQAVVGGAFVGVRIDDSGCRFFERRAGDWIELSSRRAFAPMSWPDPLIVSVHVEGDKRDLRRLADLPEAERAAAQLPLRFDPTGGATPATVRFAFPGDERVVRVAVDGAVTVEGADV